MSVGHGLQEETGEGRRSVKPISHWKVGLVRRDKLQLGNIIMGEGKSLS